MYMPDNFVKHGDCLNPYCSYGKNEKQGFCLFCWKDDVFQCHCGKWGKKFDGCIKRKVCSECIIPIKKLFFENKKKAFSLGNNSECRIETNDDYYHFTRLFLFGENPELVKFWIENGGEVIPLEKKKGFKTVTKIHSWITNDKSWGDKRESSSEEVQEEYTYYTSPDGEKRDIKNFFC